MLILQDALPLIKTFFKPVAWNDQARDLAIRYVAAFLMHFGKMSACAAAEAIRTEARHRAQVSRFLGRAYWRRLDLLRPLQARLLELESQRGTLVFCIDQTACTQQGQHAENTYSCRNTTRRPRKGNRKQKKSPRRSCHCFVMGLLITPSGIRVPFSKSFYTKDYGQKRGIKHRTQAQLAAELIDQLPLPETARVLVVGDTAFDAKVVRSACAARGYHWIVPINPERVLAGEKPRPRVSSLAKQLHADQLVCLEVHPVRGQYVAYRRIARCRIGPKLRPRTFYVHQESRDVHSVGKVRLVFSTTKQPANSQPVEVQKILMTNDLSLSLRDVIELYQLRWQIELFFKELKSTLGLHHYRFRRFEHVERWVALVLATFLYLEWLRARKLKRRGLPPKEHAWWAAQRSYGLARAIRQTAEQRELSELRKALSTRTGQRRLSALLSQAHPKEYRAVI